MAQSATRQTSDLKVPGSIPGGGNVKKILRGGIFKHGFVAPLDIKFESLDSLFHRSGLFIQIHFGVVCLIESIYFFDQF